MTFKTNWILVAKVTSWINSFLTFVILLGCVYILVLPFLGTLQSQIKKSQDTTSGLVYQTKLAPLLNVDPIKLKPIPDDNRLVIPKILVDGPISDGGDKSALDRGYWRRTPDVEPFSEDNLVIAGHRNIYSWTLYDLDKLTTGDIITIYWQKKEFNYQVTRTYEVEPTAIEIEAPTNTSQLTIYTCTPILTAEKRLVIIAKPYEKPISEN